MIDTVPGAKGQAQVIIKGAAHFIQDDAGEALAQVVSDDIPDTLIDLLKHIAIDFVPETQAAADAINQWIANQPKLPAGTTAERVLGNATFEVRGTAITAWAQPYRFYLLQMVQDEFAQLDEASQQAVRALLTECDMAEVLETNLSRRIGRSGNLEVWV